MRGVREPRSPAPACDDNSRVCGQHACTVKRIPRDMAERCGPAGEHWRKTGRGKSEKPSPARVPPKTTPPLHPHVLCPTNAAKGQKALYTAFSHGPPPNHWRPNKGHQTHGPLVGVQGPGVRRLGKETRAPRMSLGIRTLDSPDTASGLNHAHDHTTGWGGPGLLRRTVSVREGLAGGSGYRIERVGRMWCGR